MEKWVISAKRADFQEIGRKFGVDQVIARLIRNRDQVTDEEIHQYLHGRLDDLHSYKKLKGIDELLHILEHKIKQQKKIRIIGDYDIDGVCATYILLKGLQNAGAMVDVDIPDRMKDGYGISEELIDLAYQAGTDTIITCDNGISAMEQIKHGKKLGMTILVTDHHDVPYETLQNGETRQILPMADAIVNPKQEGCLYPFKGICGAMVAFKVITGLYDFMGIPKKALDDLIPFAAIATVGDVMELKDENRIIVREGLLRLQNPENIGLKALIRANHLEDKTLTAYHIGFVLGPCMNASGRLSTAKRALQLLLTLNEKEASILAEDLLSLNESRKEMTSKGVQQAIEIIESSSLKEDRVLVIYLSDCHESLAGIIAGRIRERYYKPVFVLTKGEEGVKGSGRSIEGYHMYEEMVKCKELFTKFGGHPMAAGLSMKKENVDLLRKTLNKNCQLTEDDLIEKVVIDVPMPMSYVTIPLIHQLSQLEPFGKGNTKPIFAQKNIQILNCRVLGKNRNVVKMQLRDEYGYTTDGVWFGDGDEFMEKTKEKQKFDMIYYPSINTFREKENIEMIVQSFR